MGGGGTYIPGEYDHIGDKVYSFSYSQRMIYEGQLPCGPPLHEGPKAMERLAPCGWRRPMCSIAPIQHDRPEQRGRATMQRTFGRVLVALAALLLLACSGGARHVDDDRKNKKDDGESSEADTFLADMVKKTNCNAKEIPYIFQRARSLSLKIAMSEIQNEFKGCQKSKALGDTSSSDESSKDQESIEPIPPKSLDPEVIFVDRFKNPEKYEQNWIEPFGRMSTIHLKNNSNRTIETVRKCQEFHHTKIMEKIAAKDVPAAPKEGQGERRRRQLLSKEQALDSLQMLAPATSEETIQVVIGSPKKYEGNPNVSVTKDVNVNSTLPVRCCTKYGESIQHDYTYNDMKALFNWSYDEAYESCCGEPEIVLFKEEVTAGNRERLQELIGKHPNSPVKYVTNLNPHQLV